MLSKEIKFAKNAHTQIEETEISDSNLVSAPKESGKISIHNKKNAIANHDLFVLNKYVLHSLTKNRKKRLCNFYSL